MNKAYQEPPAAERPGEVLRPIKAGRIKACMTQEEFAETVHTDARTIRKYESGELKTPDELILTVAELVDDPMLVYRHFKETYPIADDILPDVRPVPLAQAVVQLLHELEEIERSQIASKLLSMAADGLIDPAERHDFDFVMSKLAGVRRAVETLRYYRR